MNLRRSRKKRNLFGQVAHDLGQRIVAGEIKPGQPIPQEMTLCEEMGVSRTVIREAIKSLASKGLVESRCKRGTLVRPARDWNHLDPDVIAWEFSGNPGDDKLLLLIEFRQTIEPCAAAMAARVATGAQVERIRDAWNRMDQTAGNSVENFLEADIRFHAEIMHATGNPFFSPMANVISASLENSLRVTNCLPSDNLASVPLHLKVLEAIEQRQPAKAQDAMQSMLDDAKRRIDVAIEKNRQHFSK